MLRNWPRDAVMITAARAGEEYREPGERWKEAECRHCGCKVIASEWTYNRALNFERETGGNRPVKYFCTVCVQEFNLQEVDYIEDHRTKEIRPC